MAITTSSSGPYDDANAHGALLAGDTNYPLAGSAGKFDGGPFDLWFKRVREGYSKYGFSGQDEGGYNTAYYIGLMAHLVQDQEVPAHAANIYHAKAALGIPLNPDTLEEWSYDLSPNESNTPASYDINPGYYYSDKIGEEEYSPVIKTQDKILSANWEVPGSSQPYWYVNKTNAYTGQAFLGDINNTTEAGGWGYYGGIAGEDMYAYHIFFI